MVILEVWFSNSLKLVFGKILHRSGDAEQKISSPCLNLNAGDTCYKTKTRFLSSYIVDAQYTLEDCTEECIDKQIKGFLDSEKNRLRSEFTFQSYVIRCPCLRERFCEENAAFFDKIDCPTMTTESYEQPSSSPSKISTRASQTQSTMEDQPTSDDAGNDLGSTSFRGTTIHISPTSSVTTSTPASTLAKTSQKEEATDKSTSMTIETPQKTETTGTTATTTTIYDTTEEPSQTRLATSTVGTDEPSTNGHLSTSEPDLSSISESTTSSTLGSTTDTIRTSGTTLQASSSHVTTDSSSWSSILIGKWTTTMLRYETVTSFSVYEKPSKITTTIADWSTTALTTTMATTEAATFLTSLDKTSRTPTKSQLEESTYMTSTYKTTTLHDLQTSSEKVTERKTISSSPTVAPSQEASPTMIQDFTYRTSTRSEIQASSEASSEPAAAPIHTATPSQGMGTSPTPELEKSIYTTTTYPEIQGSSEKASTVTSTPSLLTTILSQGRDTSTIQLRETTTIYQGPQTSSEKVSSRSVISQTNTATPSQGTTTPTLPEESTLFSTSDMASLTPGEGPENTDEKLPIISSRITRYYQPSSSSTTPVTDQTASSTVAHLPYGATIDKASSVTSASYAEVYSPVTPLSTLLRRGDGTTSTAMDEHAQGTSSIPISEKVPSSYTQTELSYPWTTETPGTSSAASTTPTTPRFASSTETVKFEGTTLETTRLTDQVNLETTSPMKESETTASRFLYFTNLAETQQGSGSVTTTSAPKEEDTIKAATTEAEQLTDLDEVEATSTLNSGNYTATSSTSYSSQAPPESTTARSWECALPCPLAYLEGSNYCYRLLQNIRSTMNYREAFHLCAVEEKGDMADEVDLRDGLVQQLLRNARYASTE
ncbi:unnamed protein product [Nippostrongylus brasiliensis]|uniref:Apple domain-containing protein n=1 Tax=Nippostrongylus brasiliensis TaxID=27835 RepID=A0A0N4YD33_NIPBR|nr:unnamed protein product [Nippostrongylus brasiliensis]